MRVIAFGIGPLAWMVLPLWCVTAWAEVQEGGVVRIPAQQVEALRINHPQGALTLRGWDQPEIHISFLKRAPTAAMIDRLRVQVDLRGGQVQIRSGIETQGGLRSLPQPDSSIDLTLDVPRRAQVAATTFSGDLLVSGFRSGVDLGSDTGAIRVSDVSGAVRTHTGRGDQRLRSIQGEVDASGVNGDVELAAVEGPSLTAQVVQGQITARDIRSPVVTLQATLGALLLFGALLPEGHYTLHVDEGDIRVRLPEGPGLRFAVDARGRRVDSGFRLDPGAIQAADHLAGAYHGGGAVLDLRAAGGQITLLPQEAAGPR